jgi:4-carboxymuconolactone decarboxylase
MRRVEPLVGPLDPRQPKRHQSPAALDPNQGHAMTEPRFPELRPNELDAAQAKIAADLTRGPRGSVRGPYVPLIYSPDLADRMRHLGDFIRFEGVLPPKLKEIVIFTVARHWSVEFMFAIHRDSAAKLGVTQEQIEALARGARPQGLTAQEHAAYEMALELLRTARVGDAAYDAAAAPFDRRGLIELVNFVGYYTTLAMILNTARIPLPQGAPALPPVG